MSWQPELDELRRREAFAEQLGGPERVQRQHDGGRYTIRERIEKLADAGTFHEIGKVAGMATYDDQNNLQHLLPSNFVFGRARLDGRPVIVGGDDFTVRGGSADATIRGKHLLCEQMAHELRLPLIRLVEGSGGGGSVQTIETTGRANVPGVLGWEWVVWNMGTIPRVALGLGSVASLGAARRGARPGHRTTRCGRERGAAPLPPGQHGRPSPGPSRRQHPPYRYVKSPFCCCTCAHCVRLARAASGKAVLAGTALPIPFLLYIIRRHISAGWRQAKSCSIPIEEVK